MQLLNKAYDEAGFEFDLVKATRITDLAIFYTYTGDNEDVMSEFFNPLRKGGLDTLNVFWVNLSDADGTLGYASFPGFEENTSDDKLVMDYRTMTGGEYPYGEGGTLVHEVCAIRPIFSCFRLAHSLIHSALLSLLL